MDSNTKEDGLVHAQNYIFGTLEDCEGGNMIDSVNPATGQVWARIPDSGEEAVNRAVYAGVQAYPSWAELGYAKRAEYLTKVADLLEKRLDEFALAESTDQGKPLSLAKAMDIPRAVLNLRSFAESWTHILESSNSIDELGVINYTNRAPIGVAGLIAPWNLPLYLLTFKVAPALMAGNTVVVKPSEMTSVTAWMLAKLFHEAGVPRGVFNLVCGYGAKAGEAIVKHRDTKIISFTGSTVVGQKIAGLAAPSMKKLSLELGGKNAAIVFGDVDVAKVVPSLIRSAFLNQGEICLCTSRVFVHESIYEDLLSKLIEATKRLSVGDPGDPNTFVGAINSKAHLEKIKRYIGYAKEDGGQIWCGETVSTLVLPESLKGGYYCQPTVITGLKDDSRCMQDEIFGPVVCLTPFKGESEVVERANGVQYGLCASVWANDVGVVHRVSSRLQVGTVWANCWLVRSLDMPFGGCKMSGIGREGLRHSLEAYTEEKTVCLKVAAS